MTNNILNETLTALFFIAEKQKTELCLNPEDGKIYVVKERDKEQASLLPLTGNAAPLVCFNPKTLIFRGDLALQSDKNGLLTEFCGIITGKQRENNGITTGTITDGERLITGPGTETARAFIGAGTVEERGVVGKGKVNLPRFSDFYAGDVAAVCVQIEALIDKIIFATNKNETIKKIITFYENAKKAAQKQNLFALKNIEKSLAGIVEKQKAMRAGVEKMNVKATIKKRIIKVLSCAALLSGLYFYFVNVQPPSPTPQKSAFSVGFSTDLFEEAVSEYEIETGRKIYPKGRECLRRACRNCKTKKEIINIIKKNM